MNPSAARLPIRLLGIQLGANAVTFGVTILFAPRVLVLEGATPAASVVITELGAMTALFAAIATLVATRPLRPSLRTIALGSSAVAPEDLLALYTTPSRLALASALFAVAASVGALAPPLRPPAIDLYAGVSLVLLMTTMISTASLASYVMMRASVTTVLELAPHDATERALRLLGPRVVGRVRKRFIAAVAAPVAFVALGASLLVVAHARSADRAARIDDAKLVVTAALDPDSGAQIAGQPQVIAAAARFGLSVEVASRDELAGDRRATGTSVVLEDLGTTHVSVPLDGRLVAEARFGAMPLPPIAPIYVLLAAVAVGLAALLGTRIGAAFESDVALATRQVKSTGADDVVRGTMILQAARFSDVEELLEAVDALGGVFREFASAQQRAIDAREANERMRGLLLASMSHDLKAPLNAVLGFAELVSRNPLSDGQRESLAIILQRGRELLMLIDTILDSARVEAGELEVSPEATDVADIVMSSVLEARDLAVGTDVQIKGEIQPDLPTLLVDGTRIVQALTAIVMTAVRFSDKGVVPVRATLPDNGGRLRIEVETRGEGLPVGEREKIFDAFKSAESARRHGALGLGLQLARSILEIHAGGIAVDSTDGGGMVFRVWIPVVNDRASIQARATRPSIPFL